jgi:hypothetical protein
MADNSGSDAGYGGKLSQLISRFACNEIDQEEFLTGVEGIGDPPPESPMPRLAETPTSTHGISRPQDLRDRGALVAARIRHL